MARTVPRSARRIREHWHALDSLHGSGQRYNPELIENLPAAARRWISHSVAAGTPLARSVRLTMQGQIRLGAWRPFTATELLTPGVGFIWAATAKVAGLPVLGYDRFTDGRGEMRWRLADILPVVSAHGPDVTESAAGRLAGESIFVPTAFAAAQWIDGGDGATTHARWAVAGYEDTVHLDLADDGTLRQVRMQRWGNPDGNRFDRYPFAVSIDAEDSFAGITIPIRFRARWATDTAAQTEFFRAQITDAVFQ
jgi:hypothetical protein